MKHLIPIIVVTALLGACEQKTTTVVPPDKKTESNTTIVNPPAQKTEKSTTIVNPPPAEKKTETTATTTSTSPNP